MDTSLQKAANTVWAGLQGIAKVTEHGLEIKEQIDIGDFKKAFNLLLFLDDKYKVFINFALGDLYNALDMKHGQKKAQILDTWGEGWYQRLSTLGGVAARIPKFSRQNYQLSWHVYESFSLKSIPQEVRETGLQAAAKMKANGQYVTRETLRHSVNAYKQPKQPGPQWNNGEGGSFGDAADRAQEQPPQATVEPLEPDNTPDVFQGPLDVGDAGRELVRAFNALSSEDAAELVKRGQVPEPSPHTTYAEPMDAKAHAKIDYERILSLEAEISRLRDTMASWADRQVVLPEKTIEELRKRLGKYMLTHTESDWGISEMCDNELWEKAWRPR